MPYSGSLILLYNDILPEKETNQVGRTMFEEQIQDSQISLQCACHGLFSLEILIFCTPMKL